MFRKLSFRTVLAAILLPAMLLAGCQSATPLPTEDAAMVLATADAIRTQAAGTIVAELTANAPVATNTLEATATTPPTETSEPTATMVPETATPVPPTATATIVWPTWTSVPSGTPAPTGTPTSYKCAITDQSPAYGLEVKPGEDFDAVWTIKNTGSDAWAGNNTDARYLSGTKMQKSVDAVDLGNDLAKDQTVKIAIDMYAPKDAGFYTATWGMVSGNTTLCVFNVSIKVVP